MLAYDIGEGEEFDLVTAGEHAVVIEQGREIVEEYQEVPWGKRQHLNRRKLVLRERGERKEGEKAGEMEEGDIPGYDPVLVLQTSNSLS